MRTVLVNLFRRSPFENTFKHAIKVAQCGPLFVKAVESYFEGNWDQFDFLKEEIRDLEAEADRIKRNIRAHLPRSILMPVEKSVFLSFLKEADKVVDCVKNVLYWMSYCHLVLPEEIQRDFVVLVKEVGDYIGFLPEMVSTAHKYFQTRTEEDRVAVKYIIGQIRFRERGSDDLEKTMFIRLCAEENLAPKTYFIMIRIVETTGDIADHLENSADMMRAMIAR
jgi:predicted phosphate transport protein (TIGR00153 family)